MDADHEHDQHQHDHDHDHDHPSRPQWGLLLVAVGAVATCWLGATGRLELYIHPRYLWFTMIMAALGGAAAIAAFAVRAHNGASGRQWGAVLAVVAAVVALLVVPPGTLTSSAAQQRSVNSAAEVGDIPQLAGADTSSFTVRDWAAIVTQEDAAGSYSGQRVKLVGFVTAVDANPNFFYLTRFVITCCTVDAQPVGVPVAAKAWAGTYHADQWLEVTGRLLPAKDAPGGAVLVIEPSTVRPVAQPAQPYEY